MHRREMERLAVECVQNLEALGVNIEILTDFDRVPEILDALAADIGPANNPEKLLMTSANAFWVVAYRGGEPMAAFGVRADDLGMFDAQSFLPRSIEVIFDVKVEDCMSEVFAGRKWIRAAYFGGLISRLGRGGGLGKDSVRIIQLMTAYAHHCAFRDLGSQVNYCFLRGGEGTRGLRYGFLDADPFVWQTDRPMYSDGNPEWVMQLPVDRASSLMASMSVLMQHRLAENKKPLRAVEIDHAARG